MTLYPAGADGTIISGAPIWSGALVNHFRSELAYEPVKLMGSGEAYSTEHQVDEETLITLDRSWILSKVGLSDFKPARNQQYILQVVWSSEGYWYSRTYYGVTPRRLTYDSQQTNQFLVNQVFRAQYSLDAGGPNATLPVYTPITIPPNASQPVGFFREDPFVVGQNLLGIYNFAQAINIGLVEFIGLAPASPTTLTLMVNGVATSQTLVIPAGTPNTAVEASVNLNGYGVPAGNDIQWQITSGPIPENAAYLGALMMQVTNQ